VRLGEGTCASGRCQLIPEPHTENRSEEADGERMASLAVLKSTDQPHRHESHGSLDGGMSLASPISVYC
jgi:hypothetical protein